MKKQQVAVLYIITSNNAQKNIMKHININSHFHSIEL